MRCEKVVPIGRFFGPVTEGESETLTEYLLDDNKLRDALKRMLNGGLTPREFSFDVQVLAETTYARLWGNEAKLEAASEMSVEDEYGADWEGA